MKTDDPAVLAVFDTHPTQYRAPVYRALQQRLGIPVVVVYGSDCSVAGMLDREFGKAFSWDTDLLSGYPSVFLSRAIDPNVSVGRRKARGIASALRGRRVGAALLCGYNLRFHLEAFWHARRSGYPLIFRGETCDHAVHRTKARALVRDRLLRWYYGQCEKLLYIGQRSLEHFTRLGFSARELIFSPYCVDIGHFATGENDRQRLRGEVRRKLGIRESETAVLFAGKVSSRKGPDVLLEAVARLPNQRRRDIVTVFLGSGDMQECLGEAVNGTPDLKVRFLGFQNQTRLSPYYHSADLLVLPSIHSETWGLVVNEALHHGLPCVVSDAVGCAPDLVDPGVTGEVCSAGSPDSLAAALMRGINLIERRHVRDACRAKVAGYSVDEAAAGIAGAYLDVIHGLTRTALVGR